MSIFGKIMSAIFGTKAEAAPAGGAAAGGSSSAPAAGPTVDVAPILDKAVAAKGEKLEWRTSIDDLMKALDIDSASRHARSSPRSSATPATAMTRPV